MGPKTMDGFCCREPPSLQYLGGAVCSLHPGDDPGENPDDSSYPVWLLEAGELLLIHVLCIIHCGIIFIHGASVLHVCCSTLSLVCWDVILLVTGLLRYNVGLFSGLLYVCGDVNLWIKETHKSTNIDPQGTMMIPQYVQHCYSDPIGPLNCLAARGKHESLRKRFGWLFNLLVIFLWVYFRWGPFWCPRSKTPKWSWS